jgi:hypothetical protein
MAKVILDARVYLAEVDLSGVANAAALNLKTDIVDCTAFSDAYKDHLAGLTDVIAEVSGFFSAEAITGNPDKKMFDQLALSNAVLTMATGAGAFGEVAYFFRPTLSQYQPFGGKVSDMAQFKLHGEGAAPLVRGRVLMAKAEKTSTSYGLKYNLGAYSATQKLYAALHVFAKTGTPTLDATIAIADRISTFALRDAGTGYSHGDVLTIVQADGSLGTVTVDTVDGGGGVTALVAGLTSPGSGYSVANGLPTTSVPSAGRSGCTVDITAITDTTVLAFAQKTDMGFEWKTDDGPITDVNFKAKWTIGGGSPNITFCIVAGIV